MEDQPVVMVGELRKGSEALHVHDPPVDRAVLRLAHRDEHGAIPSRDLLAVGAAERHQAAERREPEQRGQDSEHGKDPRETKRKRTDGGSAWSSGDGGALRRMQRVGRRGARHRRRGLLELEMQLVEREHERRRERRADAIAADLAPNCDPGTDGDRVARARGSGQALDARDERTQPRELQSALDEDVVAAEALRRGQLHRALPAVGAPQGELEAGRAREPVGQRRVQLVIEPDVDRRDEPQEDGVARPETSRRVHRAARRRRRVGERAALLPGAGRYR